jgi:hypothetical protein
MENCFSKNITGLSSYKWKMKIRGHLNDRFSDRAGALPPLGADD